MNWKYIGSSFVSLIYLMTLGSSVFSDDTIVSGSNGQRWNLALKAYQSHQIESGHIHLNKLIDDNPGEVDLALKCLEKIMDEAGQQTADHLRRNKWLKFVEDRWSEKAARRLCALERIAAVSANSEIVRNAFTVLVEHHIWRGRRLDALELIDRFVNKQPHDPFWRIAEARLYRRVGSSKTKSLFEKLRTEMDLNHPDKVVRDRWIQFDEEMKNDKEELPKAIQPLPVGSPLAMMDPDDPDGEWQLIRNRPAANVYAVVDRLAGKALEGMRPALWRDKTGLTDPARALDLHLLNQTEIDLTHLRKLQDRRCAQEDTNVTDALALYRRYPWSVHAQKQLLVLANRTLWEGRPQAALRSFRDLLDHAADAKLRDAAQVGYWAALANLDNPPSLEEMLEKTNPNRHYPWLGKPTQARDICKMLISSRSSPAQPSNSGLEDLTQHVVRTPDVPGWSGEYPGEVDVTVVDDDLLVSARNMLVMYNARKPNQIAWSQSQRHPIGDQKRTKDQPGYFRPRFHGNMIYTRCGFGSEPHGIAALSRTTGRPLWATAGSRLEGNRRREISVPMGDPLLADGLLFFLQWNAKDNINHARDRRLSIVCFDPKRSIKVWEANVVQAQHATDITKCFERANPASAIYGNRVMIHQGAIYSNSNCGIIARSDVRDGRMDWIHCYSTVTGPTSPNLGSAPIVAGDKVICMPRDAGRIFALDMRTGRLVWENPFVPRVQLVGVSGNVAVVRGRTDVVGIDVANGDILWHRPMTDSILGRAKLVDSSLYVGTSARLYRLSASTGQTLESRAWALIDEGPRNFTLRGRDLFVVTDKPEDDPQSIIAAPAADGPKKVPLKRLWSLPRDNAIVAMPPENSDHKGSAFIYSSGILESIKVSAQGGIRWRRFVNALDPNIQFAGKSVLLIDQAHGRLPGFKDRIIAFDASSGRTLWQRSFSVPLRQLIDCGDTLVFHNGQNRLLALDQATGRLIWDRDFGFGRLLRLSRNANRLQTFFVSRSFTPKHLLLDSETGITLEDHTVEPPAPVDGRSNAQPLKDGYYEVKIKPVRARYVRLIALSEVNGAGWASAAEFQVIGAAGQNLRRDLWKIHKASPFETKHRYGRPELLFDGDPRSWWHSPWKGGIPPHPHEFQIDLGAQQTVTGIRVLPAVIINNNGMIRDYELYLSNDGQNWGAHVAKGILVNRMHVNQAHLAGQAVYFENNDRWTKTPQLLRYAMDGKPAKLLRKNAKVVFLQDPYYVVSTRKKNGDFLIVHRFDKAEYQFELGSTKQLDPSQIDITGGRLVMAKRNLLVADLARRRFIIEPSDNKQKHNQNGLVLQAGADMLIKIVPGKKNDWLMFLFNLRTGKLKEYAIANQVEPFLDFRHPSKRRNIRRIDEVLLLTNNNMIVAWTHGGDLKN